MSFLTVCRALEQGGAELLLSNPVVAVFATRRADGDVFWRVTEPGRIEVASSTDGPWTAASHTITSQLDLAGRAVIDHERRATMHQLDLSLTEARAKTATPASLELARNRAKSAAGEAQKRARIPTPQPDPWDGAKAGMDRAADHADAVTESWSDRAMGVLIAVASRGQPFTCPDVRHASIALGLPAPPNARAWGAVVNRASRAGLIRKTGRFHSYGDSVTHTTDVAEWVRA